DFDGRHLCEKIGQLPCQRVVFGQSGDVVIEGVEAGGCDVAGLSHRPTPHLLVPPRFLDQLRRSGDYGSKWTAETPCEVDPRGVKPGSEITRRGTGRDAGVEEPRAVQVRPQTMSASSRKNIFNLVEAPYASPRQIDCLLENDEP